MATISNPLDTGITDETPRRPPPLLAVGPLGWLRTHLFASWFDTVLTIVAGILILGALSSFFSWVIGQANWFVVTFNLRLLLVGRMELDALWRVELLTLITAFTIGLTIAAWGRVSRGLAVFLVVLLALMFIIPPVIQALIPQPPSFVAVGNLDITSGASSETPQENLGFIAKAGETLTIRVADEYGGSDQALSTLSSFTDKASSLLANAAENRLETAARIIDINNQLESDLLTAGQRQLLEIQLGKLEVPPPIAETFAVNQGTVNVRVLDGTTLDPVAEATLAADSSPLTVQLPKDGWYVLEKHMESDEPGAAILKVDGLAPILEREFSRNGDIDETDSSSAAGGGRYSQYVRMTDGFTTEEIRPVVNGKDVPMAIIIDNRYQGNYSFQDYLILFVAPFLNQLNTPFLELLLAAAIGFGAGLALTSYQRSRIASAQSTGHVVNPRRLTRRAATWLLIALPVLMFALIYGVGSILPLTDTRRWGGLMLTIMLTVVGIVASFPLGVALALGRRSHLPVISLASTLYIEFVRGVPLITVLFMAQLLVPLVNPSLADMPNVFRAMIAITLFSAAYLAENVRGGLQSIPPGQEEAAKALGLNNIQVTINITLPQALRAVLPALVGMAISLFKDTSLVAIVGLLDLTGMSQNIVSQTEFIGLRRETIIFITLLYFAFSYVIAAVSRRVEESGAGAAQTRQI